MNDQRLHRTNSCIRVRNERTVNLYYYKWLFNYTAELKTQNRLGSFVTCPNAFKQCTITMLIIHSAIFITLEEKLPDCSFIIERVFLYSERSA